MWALAALLFLTASLPNAICGRSEHTIPLDFAGLLHQAIPRQRVFGSCRHDGCKLDVSQRSVKMVILTPAVSPFVLRLLLLVHAQGFLPGPDHTRGI